MMKVLVCGIALIDLIAADLPKIASPSEVVFCPQGIELHLGGHALNVSQNLIKVGMSPQDILVIAPVGTDTFGNFIKEELSKLKVNHDLQFIEVLTSKDLILVVKDEDRRYHVDVGANLYLQDDKILNVINTQTFECLYLGGAGLLGDLDGKISTLFKTSREKGMLNVLDIVTPHEKEWNFILPCLEHVDIFHCNDIEARNITSEIDPEAAIRKLHETGCKIVILTRGADGVMACLEDGTVLTQDAFQVGVVDPTGAGDAFCAGLMHEILHHSFQDLTIDQWKNVFMHASAVAASCLTGIGTSSGVNQSRIQQFIKTQGQDIIQSTKVMKK